MITVNKYFPFAFIYFFINAAGLPFGLTYMALLAPFFYVWVTITRKKEVLLPFILVITPFVAVHILYVGVEMDSYLLSVFNLLLVYVFCQAFYTFLLVCDDKERVFRRILVINFILCLVAIPFFFSSNYALFWDQQILTEGVGRMRRLRLFTYEPSYYAFLFTPIALYFLVQYFLRKNHISGIWLLPMILLPYILSLSIGVIGAILLALFFTWIFYFNRLTSRRRILNTLISAGFVMASSLFVAVMYFRSNPLFIRMRNIFTGRDTSGRGRTYEAFMLAEKMLQQGSEWWGIGLGQIKILGDGIIRDFYLYNMDIVVTLPNAAAETLAMFGWAGLLLRIAIELFLFFHTRVWTNYYRLVLFLFVFIYQFTGSFITNIAEYVIWILAFCPVFPQFNVQRVAGSERSAGPVLS